MLAAPGCQDVPLRCLSTTVMAPLVLATVVAGGCAEGPQVAVAWRAGAAAWPENSRTALKRLPPGVPVHVDAFLAFDRQPVLNALPYLDESRCETLAGNPIEEPVWLLQEELASLQAGWRCGVVDPAFPDAATVPDSLVGFDELLAMLADGTVAPSAVHLQAGWAPNVSHDPDVFAAELLERWVRADTGVELVILADTGLALQAFEARAKTLDLPITTTLLWPRLPPKGSQWGTELGVGLGVMSGTVDVVQAAEDAGADSILIRPSVADRGEVRALRHAGIGVAIGPLTHPADAPAFERWPVDTLYVADPTEAQ